jgi:hypothetical protein
MKLTSQQRASLTPLARWLLDYVRERDTTLTQLSREAGLSLGALRSLVIYPERIPTIETCLRLAQITGRSRQEIIELAGRPALADPDSLDPDRIKLLRAFDNLRSLQLRQALAAFTAALVTEEQSS